MCGRCPLEGGGPQGRKNSSDLSRSSLYGSTRSEIANPKSLSGFEKVYRNQAKEWHTFEDASTGDTFGAILYAYSTISLSPRRGTVLKKWSRWKRQGKRLGSTDKKGKCIRSPSIIADRIDGRGSRSEAIKPSYKVRSESLAPVLSVGSPPFNPSYHWYGTRYRTTPSRECLYTGTWMRGQMDSPGSGSQGGCLSHWSLGPCVGSFIYLTGAVWQADPAHPGSGASRSADPHAAVSPARYMVKCSRSRLTGI